MPTLLSRGSVTTRGYRHNPGSSQANMSAFKATNAGVTNWTGAAPFRAAIYNSTSNAFLIMNSAGSSTNYGSSYAYFTDGGYAPSYLKTNAFGATGSVTLYNGAVSTNGYWVMMWKQSASSGPTIAYQTTANLTAAANWSRSAVLVTNGNGTPGAMFYDSTANAWFCSALNASGVGQFYYSTSTTFPTFTGAGGAETVGNNTAGNGASFIGRSGLKHPTIGWVIVGSSGTTSTYPCYVTSTSYNTLHSGTFRTNYTAISGYTVNIKVAYNPSNGIFCMIAQTGSTGQGRVATATVANINSTSGFNNFTVPPAWTTTMVSFGSSSFYGADDIVYNPKLNKFVVTLSSIANNSASYLQWTSTSPDGSSWSSPVPFGNGQYAVATGQCTGLVCTKYGNMVAYGTTTTDSGLAFVQ